MTGPADLRHVDTWLFDLDNTLYPVESGFMSGFGERMTDFVMQVSGLPRPEALALQKITAEVQRRFTHGGTKNMQTVPSPSREFELLSDLYAEKLGKQPMKREELPGGKSVERVLTAEELRQQLAPAMVVEDSELRLLAQERAKGIREYLIEQGRLPDERVFLVEAELAASEGKAIRVHLNLTGS